MSFKDQIFIVIPAYNESKVVASVIDELNENGYSNVIVVDDGSSDSTYKALLGRNVTVLRHMLNRGKGAAVKTGIEAAKRMGAQIVITFDADGQHDPKDIAGMIELLHKGSDVVLGKRDFSSKKIPYFKRLGNRLGNMLTWMVYGLWVQDSQSGLRAYSNRALDLIQTSTDRYEYDSEVIREIARNNLKWIEYPMHVRYTKYSQEKLNKQSAMGGLKTAIRMILSN
ncbi:glycosyltransferase family 2 protein [Candidatus Roizmanbacteria bacterium CG_4_10_14_0_8_um_filter_39_9]|uniref:Glycosyltransferase family 2 protein n=1 Tax=Candidatus Roizmanbacteria bacterium CG_4_10_14_0_8_um_filter_39_9 TaxID=1974829 RepID=A0A2M7QDE5_9BACT|nr:MAG: glycosyltransferase family 2 protein [Candidatus Roizmanbacteria bacterium CG_4_10_14_0_8_um_filter_39_9]